MKFSTHYESFLIIACLSLSLSQDSKFLFCTISSIFEYFVNLHAKVHLVYLLAFSKSSLVSLSGELFH